MRNTRRGVNILGHSAIKRFVWKYEEAAGETRILFSLSTLALQSVTVHYTGEKHGKCFCNNVTL